MWCEAKSVITSATNPDSSFAEFLDSLDLSSQFFPKTKLHNLFFGEPLRCLVSSNYSKANVGANEHILLVLFQHIERFLVSEVGVVDYLDTMSNAQFHRFGTSRVALMCRSWACTTFATATSASLITVLVDGGCGTNVPLEMIVLLCQRLLG